MIQIMNVTVCIYVQNNPIVAALLYFVTVPVVFRVWV